MERKRGELWAVVLAAGEGTRMARLTSMVYGKAVPKQFAALDGDRTFVQRTLDRLQGLVPLSRTIVVVGETHLDYARTQLRPYKGVTVLAQPVDLGTGPGVLLPLSHVLAQDPDARIAIFPSDHHVEDTRAFVDAVKRGLRAAEACPAGVALLGAPVERTDTDLGWIVPAEPQRAEKAGDRPKAARHGGRPIRNIFETAPAGLRELLREMGALLSTNIVLGSGAALWQLFEEHLPSQTAHFRRYLTHVGWPQERRILEEVYWELLPGDFVQEVLAKARGTALVPMGDVGWADCGTPERLLEALRGTPALGTLLARLKRTLEGPHAMAMTSSVVVGAA